MEEVGPMKHRYLVMAWAAALLALVVQFAHSNPAAQDEAGKAIQQELSEPFCYFTAPTDQIGFKNSPNATVVTYDGAFVSAYGQLSFYAGAPQSLRPVNKRVKTLLDDYLPVIRFGFDRDGLRYDFESFATPVGLDPRGNLITFIECIVRNPGKQAQAGALGANFGDIASDVNLDPSYNWFKGQRQALKNALRTQRSTDWHSRLFLDENQFNAGKQEVSFDDGRMIQGGHLVFTGQKDGAKAGMPGLDSKFKEAAVEYDFTLRPGEKRAFRFKMPAVPTALAKSGAVKQVVDADYDDYRARTIAFWKAEVAHADRFFVSDPKVIDTFKTSLVNDLIARELNEDGRVYQRVNRIHYNYFWIRDGSYFVRTYDMLGLDAIARETLDAFVVWQDGKPVSFFKPGAPQPPGARLSVQDDYWGQVLWAVGAHCRTTGDRALLEQVYPLLQAHIDEFAAKCAKDPRGLWPVAGPYDNEAINGHYTGHSFWALLGLKYAVFMAKEMGRQADADQWQRLHDAYEANFLMQLRELAAKSEGYIPPGMDSITDGNDWDNASGGLYPFEVLSKDDPLARKTLEMVRGYNYQEGIITYGGNAWVAKQQKQEGKTKPRGTLHHYEIFYVTESNTILGEQQKVIEDLYSILAHTGSTNSGFEFGIPAWTTRDPRSNFTPHGWFAARYMSQIRNLLVREAGTEVHITSALAPLWVKPGRQVKVTDAPTFFGSVSYTLDCRQNDATLTLANRWKEKAGPTAVIFHIPWFIKAVSATVDGKPGTIAGGTIILPPNTGKVELRWSRSAEPNLSYEEAVRLYLEKFYRKPAGADYDFLFPVVRPPVAGTNE
jgi:hypothetical protein